MLYQVKTEDKFSYNESYLETFDLLEALAEFAEKSQGSELCVMSRLVPSETLRGAFIAEVFATNQQ